MANFSALPLADASGFDDAVFIASAGENIASHELGIVKQNRRKPMEIQAKSTWKQHGTTFA